MSLQGYPPPHAAGQLGVLGGAPAGRIAVHGQDRSRSPVHAPRTGLPVHQSQAPAAQAVAAGLPPAPAAVHEDSLWFTSDTILDHWVLQNISAPPVRAGLALIDLKERKNIINVCMNNAGGVRNMANYFQGCIRRAISAKE